MEGKASVWIKVFFFLNELFTHGCFEVWCFVNQLFISLAMALQVYIARLTWLRKQSGTFESTGASAQIFSFQLFRRASLQSEVCIDPKGGFYPAQQIVDKAELSAAERRIAWKALNVERSLIFCLPSNPAEMLCHSLTHFRIFSNLSANNLFWKWRCQHCANPESFQPLYSI